MNVFLAWLNGPEIIGILAVILVLFGAKKLPELARGLGQGIKEFKKSSREIQDEISSSIDMSEPPPPPRPPVQIPAQATAPEIDVTSPAAAVTPMTPPQQPKS